MRLLLFDIDGTLLHSGGAGARALAQAFRELHDLNGAMVEMKFAGLTDPAIVRDIFHAKLGRAPRNGEVEAILERYLVNLKDDVHWTAGQAKVLPGIPELLAALSARPGVLMGLLTGNVERGGRLKLGRFGLNRYFEFGGFASDAEDRAEIARVARDRGLARAAGPVEPRDVLVIGDTPRDVACGKAIGATTVAVATGPHTTAQLAEHSPDWLFEDFTALERAVQALAGS